MLVKDVEFNAVLIKTVIQEDTNEYPINSGEYIDARAVCYFHPNDLKKLGVKSGGNVSLKSDWGEVVVKIMESEKEAREGIITLPIGPWSLQLVNLKDDFTPELHVKVKAKSTEVEITDINSILLDIRK